MVPLLGTLEDVYRKALETGISLRRGPIGEPGRGPYTGDFERWMKRALGVERLSLREFCEANLGDMFSKALEMGFCFHRGPSLG
jgi:hypothetical protein